MIYEFVTPSDPITFLANDDKIAYFCAVFLGNGKAGCHREDGKDMPSSLLMFAVNPVEEIEGVLGCTMEAFLDTHRKELSDCFLSFAYTSVFERKKYDAEIAGITDPEKLADFKKKHEDERRTSMSKWVKVAWQYGEALAKPKPQTENA